MKWFIGLLMVCMVGCFQPAEKISTQPKVTTPKCKTLHTYKGVHCIVSFTRCADTSFVSVFVLNTSNNGKQAAEESIKHLTNFLDGKPKLVPLVIGKVKNHPLYVFILTGVE